MRVKVFRASSAQELEQAVNEWLSSSSPGVKIKYVTQSETGDIGKGDWAITYTIVYVR